MAQGVSSSGEWSGADSSGADSSGTDSSADPLSVEHAARTLMRGELVAFPTETVYGLGADAANAQAVARIYAAKGRPSSHPVIVHIASPSDMAAWCSHIPDQAWQLAQAFWPGPLTLILKRHPDVDPAVSGGQSTIGVRCPAHPMAHALLSAFADLKRQAGQTRAGVAAPSANRFGRVSPTRAQHVRDEFADLVADGTSVGTSVGMPVLEGGDSEVGIESSIVDVSSVDEGGAVAMLRPGAISAEDVAKVLGQPIAGYQASSPRVSGSLKAHYAPSTPVVLCSPEDLSHALADALAKEQGRLAVVTHGTLDERLFDGHVFDDRLVVLRMPDSPADYAHALYARLRELDALGVVAAVVEAVPDEPAWAGVRDRLQRAAAAFEGRGNPL